VKEEDEHEHKLIAMLKEKKLNYMGSIVLGLSDALVELTGALAGFGLPDNSFYFNPAVPVGCQFLYRSGLHTGFRPAEYGSGCIYFWHQLSDKNSLRSGRINDLIVFQTTKYFFATSLDRDCFLHYFCK